VRNLPDGRVEMIAEGDPGELDGLVEAIRREMDRYITDVSVTEAPATGAFDGFGIVY